jgi:hypothetical protein
LVVGEEGGGMVSSLESGKGKRENGKWKVVAEEDVVLE